MDLRGVHVAPGRGALSLRDHHWRALHASVSQYPASGNFWKSLRNHPGLSSRQSRWENFSDPTTWSFPKILFMWSNRAWPLSRRSICPYLTVEILFPSTETADRRVKHSLYERFRVPEYWIVDPNSDVVHGLPTFLRALSGSHGIRASRPDRDAPFVRAVDFPLRGVSRPTAPFLRFEVPFGL